MKRAFLFGTVGLLAAISGGWWALQTPPPDAPATTQAPLVTPEGRVTEAFWALEFEGHDGQRHVLKTWQGQALIVNFWASWCPPCVHEMPELDRFHQEFSSQGWQVIGVAVDNATAVREFLLKKPVRFSIQIAGFAGTELTKILGNTTGGLPFTVVINAQGVVKERITGPTSFEHLQALTRQHPAQSRSDN